MKRLILGICVILGLAVCAQAGHLSDREVKKYKHYMKRWSILKNDNLDFYNGCKHDGVLKGCDERKEIVRRLVWLQYADKYGKPTANQALSKKWGEWFELKWGTEGNDRNNVFVVLEQDLKLEEIRRGKNDAAKAHYKVKKIDKKTMNKKKKKSEKGANQGKNGTKNAQ